MKTQYSRVTSALDTSYALRAVPKAIVDWNLNRYVNATADNYPAETDNAYDYELFPIESIIEALRPTKGINKARVGHSTTGDDYVGMSADAVKPRFYVTDVDDVYKYWTSPKTSDGSGNISQCKPYVLYGRTVATNKIVITTENSWASAKTFSIQVTTSASPSENSGWVEIANQSTVGNSWKASGQIVLRWTGTGWSTASDSISGKGLDTLTTNIRGIRMVVTALEGGRNRDGEITTYYTNQGTEQQTTGRNTFFDLISIAAHLEADVSEYIIDAGDTFDMADASELYPIGTLTSNIGNITFSNLYEINGETRWGVFSRNNTDPAVPWSDYIDANANITLSYEFYDEHDNYLDTVQEFDMYVDSWSSMTEETAEVELSDYTKFFNDITVRPAMWENLNASEIILRLLDSVGYVNHNINAREHELDEDNMVEHIIPVFYTDGNKSLWEVLDELARASQTAIFVDSFGTLKARTRELAYHPFNPPVASLSSVATGNVLPNIISMSDSVEFPPNHYKVMYNKQAWTPYRKGFPVMQRVWEPEGTVVLRATPLVRTLDRSDDLMWVDANEIRHWPFDGKVNIQGEIIAYEGKQYAYYSKGQLRRKTVKSNDEKKKLDKMSPPGQRSRNHYTGALKITERGVWNSEPRRHPVDAEGYNVRKLQNGSFWDNGEGFSHLKKESKVELKSVGSTPGYNAFLLATKNAEGSAYSHYGTKFRFVKENGRSDQKAGLVIHNGGAGENGYYIELALSRMLGAKEEKERHELLVYSRKDNKDKKIATKALAIGEGIDYEIDVEFKNNGGTHNIAVWVNGKLAIREAVEGANRNELGRFGMFIRGNTKAQFEYLYALRRESRSLNDDFSFLDKTKSAFMANQWERDWVWGTRKKRRKKKKSNKETEKWKIAFYDEFGPFLHEIREFDVKFEPAPVLHSRLYLTNDWGAVATEYSADPFGAKFILANTGRINAVINGDDTLSFAGTGDSVPQSIMVHGRCLDTSEDEEVVYKNEDQIRRRGKIESEIVSPWIQSRSMAKALTKWLGEHFSWGNEQVTAEIFGNPLIEVGDIVTVNYPQKNISGQYFVISVSNKFDNGLTTSVGLRKRVYS